MIKLGVLGAGLAVEKLHGPVLREFSHEVQVAGVASRTREKAEEAARLVNASRVFDDVHALLADPGIGCSSDRTERPNADAGTARGQTCDG